MDWTDTPEGQAFIKDLARGTVSEIAPEEMDLFDEMAEDYFADPTPQPAERASDDALGFGLEAALIAVTPAATAMASAVIGFLVNEVVDTTADRTIEAVLRRIFKKDKKGEALSLNASQLARIKTLAVQQAVAHGMAAAEAEHMASTMVGSLISNA